MKRSMKRRRQILLWILSLVIAASMLCSFVVMLRPPAPRPEPTPIPTRAIPTWTATPKPTPTLLSATLAPPTRKTEPTASPSPQSSPTQSAMDAPSSNDGEIDFTFAACGDSRGGAITTSG